MASYAEYFENFRSEPLFHIGDRVFGYWNKIPFVGSVLVDNIINEDEGPRVFVNLDLPLKYNSEYKTIIKVNQKDIKLLIQI